MKELARYKKVVLWGGKGNLDSIRHIYSAFDRTLRKLGVPVEWVADDPANRHVIHPDSLVFAVNVAAAHIGPWVGGSDVVTHNFDPATELGQTVPDNHHLRLQVYTSDAENYAHEKWDECRLYHPPHTLFQPWGSDILAEETWDPVFNSGAEECCFVGAIWDDNGLGNAALIPRVEAALARRRLRFVHYTQISDAAMLEAMRRSRIAPAFAGEWQVAHNYLPCRVFKAVAAGQLAVTNVPKFRDLFGDALPWGETVEETIDIALSLTGKQWAERVRAMQHVTARFTYRESLAAFGRALEAGR